MLSGGEGGTKPKEEVGKVRGGNKKSKGKGRREDWRKKRERCHRKTRKRQTAIFRFEKRRHRFVRKILVFAFLRSS